MILSTQLLVISAFGTVGAGRDNAAARCYAAEPPGDPRSRPLRERPAGTERGCAAAGLASSRPLGPALPSTLSGKEREFLGIAPVVACCPFVGW